MALRVGQVEEVQALLRRTPALIDLYEARQPGFPEGVVAWLKALESVLEKNRLHVVTLVAQHRGVLTAARRGLVQDGPAPAGRTSRRKLAEAAALRAVREVGTGVSEAIAGRTEQLAEAGKIARQILSIAALKQILQPCLTATASGSRLECIRSAIRQDADLLPYYAALTGLVAHHDALVLLDRALSEVDLGG